MPPGMFQMRSGSRVHSTPNTCPCENPLPGSCIHGLSINFADFIDSLVEAGLRVHGDGSAICEPRRFPLLGWPDGTRAGNQGDSRTHDAKYRKQFRKRHAANHWIPS